MSGAKDTNGNHEKPRDLSEIPALTDLPRGPTDAGTRFGGATGATGPSWSPQEASGPLDGYVVALVAGKTLLGRLVPGGAMSRSSLENVLELTITYLQIPRQVQGPNGQTSIQIEVRPQQQIGRIGTFGSWKSVELPEDVVMRDIAEFSSLEFAALAKAVEAVEAADAASEAQAKADRLAKDIAGSRNFGGGARST